MDNLIAVKGIIHKKFKTKCAKERLPILPGPPDGSKISIHIAQRDLECNSGHIRLIIVEELEVAAHAGVPDLRRLEFDRRIPVFLAAGTVRAGAILPH